MLAVIDRSVPGAIKVLDCENGLIDCYTQDDITFKKNMGVRIVERPEWADIGEFYRRLIKMRVLGDKHLKLTYETIEMLQRLAGIIEGFRVPQEILSYDLRFEFYPDVCFIGLAEDMDYDADDYLYAVSPTGFNFFRRHPYNVCKIRDEGQTQEGYVFIVEGITTLSYMTYVLDKNLFVISAVEKDCDE